MGERLDIQGGRGTGYSGWRTTGYSGWASDGLFRFASYGLFRVGKTRREVHGSHSWELHYITLGKNREMVLVTASHGVPHGEGELNV